MIWRGYNEYTYVTCGRCQRKVPVQMCVWDFGRLVCRVYNCADRDKIGSKELAWAFQASQDRNEWTPHPKIINPIDVRQQIDHVSPNAGTY